MQFVISPVKTRIDIEPEVTIFHLFKPLDYKIVNYNKNYKKLFFNLKNAWKEKKYENFRSEFF